MSTVIEIDRPTTGGPRRRAVPSPLAKARPAAVARGGLLIRHSVPFFVVLGLIIRFFHYVRDPSMWHDEAALVLNVIGKSFGELLGPLYWSEAAPPLFLWAERGISLVLGDRTVALRLLPFLSGCAALVCLAPLARR